MTLGCCRGSLDSCRICCSLTLNVRGTACLCPGWQMQDIPFLTGTSASCWFSHNCPDSVVFLCNYGLKRQCLSAVSLFKRYQCDKKSEMLGDNVIDSVHVCTRSRFLDTGFSDHFTAGTFFYLLFANCTSFLFCACYGLSMIHCVFVGGLWDLMLWCWYRHVSSLAHCEDEQFLEWWQGCAVPLVHISVPSLWTCPWGSGDHPILPSHSLDWSICGQGSAGLVVKCQQ